MKRVMTVLLALALAVAPMFGNSNLHKRAWSAPLVLYGESLSREVLAKPLCTATAYKQVADGYMMLTAGHCFDPNDSHAPADVKYYVAQLGAQSDKDGDLIDGVKWQDDVDADAAEFHVKTTKHFEVFQLACQNPKVDDKVFYVGYPMMFNKVLFEGRIASEVGKIEDPENEGLDKGRIVVQIGGGPGASGSAIIDEHSGLIVGLLEGHLFENGVVMIPARTVQEFLAKPEVKHEPRPDMGGMQVIIQRIIGNQDPH